MRRWSTLVLCLLSLSLTSCGVLQEWFDSADNRMAEEKEMRCATCKKTISFYDKKCAFCGRDTRSGSGDDAMAREERRLDEDRDNSR